ncbi:MAG: hypothetical protein ACFFDD_11490 [Promethearchaeota archaeon]
MKKRKKRSSLGNTIPAKYRPFPFMLTRWMTDIDKYARKKHKEPRVLRHHYD